MYTQKLMSDEVDMDDNDSVNNTNNTVLSSKWVAFTIIFLIVKYRPS